MSVTYWDHAAGTLNPWGHITASVNGHVYSEEPRLGGIHTLAGPGQYLRGSMTDAQYAKKQQGRDHFTVTLKLSQDDAVQVTRLLQNFDGSHYNVLTNNCTDPMQEALMAIGIPLQSTIRPDSFMQTLTDNGLVKEAHK